MEMDPEVGHVVRELRAMSIVEALELVREGSSAVVVDVIVVEIVG